MSDHGEGAGSDEAISKEHGDQSVLSVAEGEGNAEGAGDQLKDPRPEKPPATVSGTGPGAEHLPTIMEEQSLEVVYENLKEGQGEEQLLEKKKPPWNLLEAVRERNARGLEQDLAHLGPGTMVHVRWPEALRKEQQSPWDTPWSYIRLTEEAQAQVLRNQDGTGPTPPSLTLPAI